MKKNTNPACTTNISRKRYVFSLLFLITLSSAHAETWEYRQQTQIKWREYGKTAFQEARANNKPLYILIYADWCHWCRKFETETLEKAPIRQLIQGQFIPVAVNQAVQPDLAKQLGARLVPTNIVLTPDGKRLLRFYGFLTAKELFDALNKTLQSWRKGEIPGEEFGDESTCCLAP